MVMENIFQEFKDECFLAIKNLPNDKKITYLGDKIAELDLLMNKENINLKAYEKLIETKRALLTKIKLLKAEESEVEDV